MKNWFHDYRNILQELSITHPRRIWNFDEAGFRVECIKRQDIIVPDDISEFYAISPENRKSLTVIEAVNAAGHKPIPPCLIIQGQELMENWFQSGLSAETLIKTSSSEFTNDEIIIEWLKHFIQHTGSEKDNPFQEWKLLFMNNHGSHEIPEFALLANKHHIRPFSFIPHLTLCMQPLDVDIFQPYKKHQDNAIRKTLSEFHLFYTLERFCNDLGDIRENTFKGTTIRSAFDKAGMWPVNSQNCTEQLKKFAAPNIKTNGPVRMLHGALINEDKESLLSQNKPSLSTRIKPQTCKDVESGLLEWLPRIRDKTQWSDPLRPMELEQFVENSKRIMTESQFKEFELTLHQKRRTDNLLQKATSRKRLKASHAKGLIKEDAEQAIADKRRKEMETEQRQEYNNMMKI